MPYLRLSEGFFVFREFHIFKRQIKIIKHKKELKS